MDEVLKAIEEDKKSGKIPNIKPKKLSRKFKKFEELLNKTFISKNM